MDDDEKFQHGLELLARMMAKFHLANTAASRQAAQDALLAVDALNPAIEAVEQRRIEATIAELPEPPDGDQ